MPSRRDASANRSVTRNAERPAETKSKGSGGSTSVQAAGTLVSAPSSTKTNTLSSAQLFLRTTRSNSRPASGWNGWVTRTRRCSARRSGAIDGSVQGAGKGRVRPSIGLLFASRALLAAREALDVWGGHASKGGPWVTSSTSDTAMAASPARSARRRAPRRGRAVTRHRARGSRRCPSSPASTGRRPSPPRRGGGRSPPRDGGRSLARGWQGVRRSPRSARPASRRRERHAAGLPRDLVRVGR